MLFRVSRCHIILLRLILCYYINCIQMDPDFWCPVFRCSLYLNDICKEGFEVLDISGGIESTDFGKIFVLNQIFDARCRDRILVWFHRFDSSALWPKMFSLGVVEPLEKPWTKNEKCLPKQMGPTLKKNENVSILWITVPLDPLTESRGRMQ